MKFRSLIWISGIAMIILALLQFYFINQTFQTKQQQFDSKYSSMAKLGLYDFDYNFIDYAEDSILNLLDDYAYYALQNLDVSDDFQQDTLYQVIIDGYKHHLNTLSTKQLYLKEYFKLAEEDTVFTTRFILRNVTLLWFGDDIPFYANDTLNEKSSQAGYLLKSYIIERNYYRMKYDLYISFTHRAERISREMLLIKTLSVATLLIVFIVFSLTLRNLLIQKRLSDLKTDFINNMTHELKTPLSTISVASSSLSLPQNKLSRERVVEISGIIKKQNKHLTRLIDRILDISIWEKDQIRIKRNEVEVDAFVRELIDDFSSIHPVASLHLHTSIKRESTAFPLDEVHMTTVMNNLFSNAVKYGNENPEIHVTLVLDTLLRIEIKDNGPGISKDDQKHIFDKFYRGKESKARVIRGLGLGLYYVKQIVEAHEGRISLDSSSEKGSCFTIEIP